MNFLLKSDLSKFKNGSNWRQEFKNLIKEAKYLDTSIVNGIRRYSISKINTVAFDYLPMQRWVHIAVVISDDYQGSTVSLYMDAQLASSTTNEKDDGKKLKRRDRKRALQDYK